MNLQGCIEGECLLLWGYLVKCAMNQNMQRQTWPRNYKVMRRSNLVAGIKSMWAMKMFIFSVEKIKNMREKPCGHKSCPININKDSNQKQTWSVTLVCGLSRNCRQMGTLQWMGVQTWGSWTLDEFGGSAQTKEVMCGGSESREEQSRNRQKRV